MGFTLNAVKRAEKGEKARGAGAMPAVVYGAGAPAESLNLDGREFLKLYRQAGEASLIDLALDGKNAGKVLVQEVQYDPVKGDIIHVDLRRIDMSKTLTAPVDLRFVGESPAIKEQGGTLVVTVHTVEVKCLPKDLVAHIDIDLSVLKTFDDVIKIKNVILPPGVAIIKPHAEDVVVKAARALTEEEIKALEEKNASLDVSKIESAKPEKVAEEGEVEAGKPGAAAPGKPGAEATAKPGAPAPAGPAGKKEEKK